MRNETQLKNNLARNLRYLRACQRPLVSQKMLAKKLQISQGSISDYERGITLPPTIVLLSIADCFGLRVEELLAEHLPVRERKEFSHENITSNHQTTHSGRKKQAHR